MSVDALREAWQANETALGAFIFTRLDPVVVEGVATMGFDYICIDTQHGLMEFSDVVSMLQALAHGTATPLVRVPSLDESVIGRALDAGALGVIVPMIESADEAARAVAACRYAPAGRRSYGPTRANVTYGPAYASESNNRVLCIPMIETAAAVEVAEDICSVPGVDAIYVGPTDLSLTYGLSPLLDNDGVFVDALERVIAAATARGVRVGIHANVDLAKARINAGFNMVTITSDFGVLINGLRGDLALAREVNS